MAKRRFLSFCGKPGFSSVFSGCWPGSERGRSKYATIENDLLRDVIAKFARRRRSSPLRRPSDVAHSGGSTTYGADCGRFPVPPTLSVESSDTVPAIAAP
ncbi:MAG: hypothetical protein H0W86_10805 [Armatimonadetes bacterium]|nr:hypothetical protein [Armatimonadota bacterium]